ncbi:MAG: nuclear transport factor 2 family protein [Mycobacterium sp.]
MSQPVTHDIDLKAISERYFAAWADRDPDAIVALHTDDTQFWTHLGGGPVVGRGAVRAAFAELFERFPDFSFETYRVLYGDDHWVLDWALISGDIRFDCLDAVVVSPDGLVARKDTFVDMVQLQASLPDLDVQAERAESKIAGAVNK